MKRPIEEYYRIVYDETDNKKWCVELLKPCAPFHGVVYSYGQFSINAVEGSEESPKFKYEMDILYVPERLRDVTLPDEKQNEMENLIATILLDIIGKNVDKTKSFDGKLYLELSRETND